MWRPRVRVTHRVFCSPKLCPQPSAAQRRSKKCGEKSRQPPPPAHRLRASIDFGMTRRLAETFHKPSTAHSTWSDHGDGASQARSRSAAPSSTQVARSPEERDKGREKPTPWIYRWVKSAMLEGTDPRFLRGGWDRRAIWWIQSPVGESARAELVPACGRRSHQRRPLRVPRRRGEVAPRPQDSRGSFGLGG
jgi:hypothetical protein